MAFEKNDKFDTKVLYEAKAKICPLMVLDNSQDWTLMGNLTPSIKLMIKENKYSKSKYDKYIAYMVPIKFTKKGDYAPKANVDDNDIVKAEQVFDMFDNSTDTSVPF